MADVNDLVLFDDGNLYLLEGLYSLEVPTTPIVILPGGTYDPTAHLPAGHVLTRETHELIMDFWISVGGRELTTDEVLALLGEPYPVPSFKVEFGTGEYPAPKRFGIK